MNHAVPDKSQGQRTLAAIVLTDAVGFSARMATDEEFTLSLIQRDQQLMEGLCQQFEGRVIKSTGDGLLMCFASAVQAVSCSLEMQHQLTEAYQQVEASKRLQHRIGIHLGDVFFKDGDVMGNGVNIAARLQTEAYPGCLCISQIVYDVVKSRVALNATFAGPLRLRNIREPQPAYHIDPETVSPDAATVVTQGEPESASAPESATRHSGGSSRDRLSPGSKIGGRYVVQRVLGQGGFGRSYLVEDSQRFGELCVVKEFFPTNASKRSLQKALDLFKREAKTLYQIDHPQVPKFLAGFTQEQRLFIVQEYVDGVTYSQLLKDRKRNSQTFTELEVKRWIIHMLQVLEYLHNLNIVHRDISPDNVMFSRDRGLPVLIDFGLVNDAMSDILSGEGEIDSGPRTNTVVGKFGYSPPEQIQLGQCYPSSDLYALGVTAIVLLTGKYPRELMSRDSLEWQWQRYVSVSYPFVNVLNRLTRRQPRERYQSASEVIDAIVPLLDSDEISSPLPQSMLTTTRIDLSLDPQAAPVYNSPMQAGPAISIQDEAFIAQCRQELTRCIGPMASLVLEDTLEQYPDASPRELVEILASQLSDGNQASQFVTNLQLPATTASIGNPPMPSGSRSGSRTMTQGGTSATSSVPSSDAASSSVDAELAASASHDEGAISSDFLARCRQLLTQCIGPMAGLLIEDLLSDYPHLSPRELVEQLAAEIPDPVKAQEFQNQLL